MIRKSKQASAVRGEKPGREHVKDPWNTLVPYVHMRLILGDSAKAALKALEGERYGTAEELEEERYGH